MPDGLRPQIGSAVKVLTGVRERFWEATKTGPYALTDGVLSMTWDPTDNQGPGAAGLTAFSGGSAAERCREAWRQGGEAALQSAFETLYPGHGAQRTGLRFMDWPSDEWAGGGYSAAAPGEITSVGPRLRAGLGRLHFAGEHACPKFAGYMEGALNSGVSVARKIASKG
jgi:monoamine oxidase